MQFKPKNFKKAEEGPVPKTKPAEALADPNTRRSHRYTRSDRGGGRGRGHGKTGGGGGGRANYESEVVFGGMVGAGASIKIDPTSKIEPGYKPEPLSGSPTTKPTKRLVKASGALASEGNASGSKQKKKGKDNESDSESGFSSCSSSDKDDDDADLLGEEDEYLPTLLASLGKDNGGGLNSKRSNRSGVDGAAAASITAVPDEMMARPAENETELNDQLAWLTEQNVDNAGLVLFQLPSVLPIPVPHQNNAGGAVNGTFGADGAIYLTDNDNGAGPSTSAAAATAATKAAEGRPASLAELSPGKIGKMLVLRNGSVKMQIGEVLFDVSPGIPCQMLQKFAAVDPSSKTITMLGDLEKRIIVTPNIDTLLSDDPLPEWKYADKNARGAAADGAGGVHGRDAAVVGKKKSNAHAVLIDSESSSSSDDEEMVDANELEDQVRNGEVEMIEDDDDDDEATEDEEEPKWKRRPAPKARRTARK